MDGSRDVHPAGERDRLPAVFRLELRQLVEVLLDRVGNPDQEPGSLFSGRPAPRLERAGGRDDGGIDVFGAALRDLGDDLARRRVDVRKVSPRAGRPELAIDEIEDAFHRRESYGTKLAEMEREKPGRPVAPLYYADYIQTDRLLGAQQMQSALRGRPAHDEMLFIIVHQTYELWFKQILWELDAVIETFRRSPVPEEKLGQAILRLGRIVEIQRVMIQQVDVLETMTPLDFL